MEQALPAILYVNWKKLVFLLWLYPVLILLQDTCSENKSLEEGGEAAITKSVKTGKGGEEKGTTQREGEYQTDLATILKAMFNERGDIDSAMSIYVKYLTITLAPGLRIWGNFSSIKYLHRFVNVKDK